MNTKKALRIFSLALSLMVLSVTPSQAFWSINLGYGAGFGYGYGSGYGCGYGCYPGPWGYAPVGPIVQVSPPPPVYVVECETVEVCDNYTDECWIERRCD
jgi:hypothetical protein